MLSLEREPKDVENRDAFLSTWIVTQKCSNKTIAKKLRKDDCISSILLDLYLNMFCSDDPSAPIVTYMKFVFDNTLHIGMQRREVSHNKPREVSNILIIRQQGEVARF